MWGFKKQEPAGVRRRRFTRFYFNIGKKFKIEWIQNLKYWKIEFNNWAE